jgi:competence protein ComEC
MTFLDVGQGDTMVLETAKGKVIVVDGGGKTGRKTEDWQRRRKEMDMGKQVVVPFLKYRGIKQIDLLVLTHGDGDHIGGVTSIVNRFPVKKVIRNPHPPKVGMEQKLINLLRQKDIPIYIAPLGSKWEVEKGISWYFLHPDQQDLLGDQRETNNDSVVFLMSIYQHQIMMTGDIEKQAEQRILSHYNLPTVPILKVAHHGSDTSTTQAWLKQLSPKDAIISVGRDNRYGHPSPKVLQRLRERKIRIWRTDQHGAVTIVFSPMYYQIETVH